MPTPFTSKRLTHTQPDAGSLLEEIEHNLFDAPDSVCMERAELVTEAAQLHRHAPPPLRRALCFKHILENMTLDLAWNPVMAGNTSSKPHAWMLMPEAGLRVDPQVAFEHPDLAHILEEATVPSHIRRFWGLTGDDHESAVGYGHFSIDFAKIVNRGLKSVIREIDALDSRGTPAQQNYRAAMRIACNAVIDWAERYAHRARELADIAADPVIRQCYARIADACRHVPAHPARNLFEGLQSMLLAHLATVIEGQGLSISVGLPDRALARFADEAAADSDAAVNWIRAFLLGVAANSFQGKGSKTQAVTIGGQLPDGSDACNSVTLAFLDAFDQTPVSDPHLFLRWHPGIDRTAMTRAVEMLSRGRSMPHIVNDLSAVPGLEHSGIFTEDAQAYCIDGCNEICIPGKCCHSGLSAGMNFTDIAVLDGALRDKARTATCLDEVFDAFETHLRESLPEQVRNRRKGVEQRANERPFPFTSACCDGTVEHGDDYLRALPYPDVYGIFIRGTTNAADSLSIIKHVVFEQRLMSLPELLQRVDRGDPELEHLAAGAPRWGNDNEDADNLMLELCRRRSRALDEVAGDLGLPRFAVCHVVRSLHYLTGRFVGPTLDGRQAGERLCDSIGPDGGVSAAGPTALLRSVLKLDAVEWFSGIYNLNLTLSSDQAEPAVLQPLLDAFLKGGGQEIQVSVMDPQQLRRAQEEPERFRDLIVRVAGLNARFAELNKVEQEELIRRAERAADRGR